MFAQLAPVWLLAKMGLSLANDAMVLWAARRPVASRSPEEAAALMKAAAPADKGWPTPYTGDPVGGAGDFVTNPNRVEAALVAADPRSAVLGLYLDCDDVATWFACATRRWPGGVESRVVTLVDANLVGSHVIAVGRRQDGSCWGFCTNGLRALPDLRPETLCAVWNGIYQDRAHFVAALDTPSPW